jgi:hypothetical protein
VRRLRTAVIVDWLAYCRSVDMPVPALADQPWPA